MKLDLLTLLGREVEAAPSGKVSGGTIPCPKCLGRMRWTCARDGKVVSVFASCSSCGAREVAGAPLLAALAGVEVAG